MKVRDGICLAFGGAALATSVLAVGGALRWTQAVVALLVALAFASQVLARRSLERFPPLVLLLAAAIALTAIQLIPLPVGILYALNGAGNHLRFEGAAIAGTTPWHSISMDPSATLGALAFFITLLGVALIALRYAAGERGRFMLLGGVAATCGLAAIVAGVHTLVSATALYGVYEPVHASSAQPIFGPLLNPNHMGGLMAIGAVLSFAIAFYPKQPSQLRVVWIVDGTACVVLVAVSQSRGAMLGLLIGLLVAGAAIFVGRGPRRRSRRSLRSDLPVALVVGVGIALALYTSAGNVSDQLQNTSLSELSRPVSKYEAWKASLTLVEQSPWVGIGRGAVETNLTRVNPGSAYFTYSHLENEYLSAVLEWGIPGALLLGGLFAWFVVVATRRWRDGPLAAAALGALAAILFQSSVDFGIELLGLAVPVTIIASTVQLVPLRPLPGVARARLGRTALLLALLAGAVALVLPFTRTVLQDHDAILAETDLQPADLRACIQRHPLDYFGFGELAELRSRAGKRDAVVFLNQALALHPTHPGLHKLAARMLAAIGHYKQAALEYSVAIDAEATPGATLNEIVAMIPNAADAAAALPTDYPNIDIMLRALKDIKRSDISEKWLVRIANEPQHDVRVIDMLYDLAMARNDLDVAKSAAELRLQVEHSTTSRAMLAKVKFQRGELDDLLKDLADVSKWTGRIDEKADAWMILCDVYIQKKQWDPAIECLHRLDASGLIRPGSDQVTTRLQTIDQQRTYESKMAAAKAMEQSLGSGGSKP